MTRVLRGIALTALLVVPAVAAASATGKVYVTNCFQANYKPKTLILACADAGALLQKLSWSKWTSTGASGKGTYKYKTCVPDCATGGFKSVPAKVALSKPVSCPKQRHKVFSRATVTFTARRPPGDPKTLKNLLLGNRHGCPIA